MKEAHYGTVQRNHCSTEYYFLIAISYTAYHLGFCDVSKKHQKTSYPNDLPRGSLFLGTA